MPEPGVLRAASPDTLIGYHEPLAFFLDFDGCLAEIAPTPDQTVVEPEVLELLVQLYRNTGGAVAIITGRPLSAIDRLLAPLVLPAGVEHGVVRRDALGDMHENAFRKESLHALAARLEPAVERHAGLLLEVKLTSLTLHYRARPELADFARTLLEESLVGIEGLTIRSGKMVLEARPGSATKGTAVEAFLREPPFEGRLPVSVGDDLTDEDAFAVVNEMGGVSIKVGAGTTRAPHRFPDRAAFLDWFHRVVNGPAQAS